MQINPYLVFDGKCAEAMRLYADVLGGKLDLITLGESPMANKNNSQYADQIMHARLSCDGGVLMASDTMDGPKYDGKHGFSVTLTFATAAEAMRVFEALSDGAQIRMPMQKTFWADAFGMLVDRYDTPWAINGGMLMP